MIQKSLPEQIFDAITNLDGDLITELISRALDQNIDMNIVLTEGLTAGLRKLGEGFEKGEVFIPELMWGAQIVQQNMEKLEAHISKSNVETKGKLLIGSVENDIHDVGKNIVCSVFSAAGYHVIDLGVDVSTEIFIQRVKEEKPDILGLSALLTTTMHNQRQIIEALEAEGLRQNIKVIIGGAPASEAWAREINADAFAEDVFLGLKKAEDLLEKSKLG